MRWILLAGLIATGLGAFWLFGQGPATPAVTEASQIVATGAGRPAEATAMERVVEPGSVDAKQAFRNTAAPARLGMTDAEIRETLEAVNDTFYDPDATDDYLRQVHAALAAGFGEEEAGFLMSVQIAESWDEIDALIRARELETGQDYGELMMVTGLAHGGLDADDIEALVARGTATPADLVLQLAQNAQVDDLVALSRRQLITDINYVDPVNGKNALAVLVQTVGFRSAKYDADDAAGLVRSLVSQGVAVKPEHGGFDPLDYALQANKFDGAVKLAMARELLSSGAPVQASHYEILAAMPDIPEKEAFYRLLGMAP